MGKMKTHKATAKRVKKTGSGKIMHEKAFGRHKLTAKSGKRKRQLRQPKEVSAADRKNIDKLLPYN